MTLTEQVKEALNCYGPEDMDLEAERIAYGLRYLELMDWLAAHKQKAISEHYVKLMRRAEGWWDEQNSRIRETLMSAIGQRPGWSRWTLTAYLEECWLCEKTSNLFLDILIAEGELGVQYHSHFDPITRTRRLEMEEVYLLGGRGSHGANPNGSNNGEKYGSAKAEPQQEVGSNGGRGAGRNPGKSRRGANDRHGPAQQGGGLFDE